MGVNDRIEGGFSMQKKSLFRQFKLRNLKFSFKNHKVTDLLRIIILLYYYTIIRILLLLYYYYYTMLLYYYYYTILLY